MQLHSLSPHSLFVLPSLYLFRLYYMYIKHTAFNATQDFMPHYSGHTHVIILYALSIFPWANSRAAASQMQWYWQQWHYQHMHLHTYSAHVCDASYATRRHRTCAPICNSLPDFLIFASLHTYRKWHENKWYRSNRANRQWCLHSRVGEPMQHIVLVVFSWARNGQCVGRG